MNVKVFSSDKNWIESSAIDQLNKTAQLEGVLKAAAMPDLHCGKEAPIGAVFATDSHIYPHLVDTDIGCGIAMWQLSLNHTDTSTDKLDRKLGLNLEGPWPGNIDEFMKDSNLTRTSFDESSLGTIGYGNHFAELTRLKKIFNAQRFEQLDLDPKSLFLLIHSGSRGLGESILTAHHSRFGKAGLAVDSAESQNYLQQHDHAVRWARLNRRLIAQRIMEALNTSGKLIIDLTHNHVVPKVIDNKTVWLHRKGAVPTDDGAALIAGSRGTLSYMVEASGDQTDNLFSAAHGAGRKWRRSDCKSRLERKYTAASLSKTELGGRVICEDKNLLYEEAPQAYKNIDVVIQDLVDYGLINTIASFAPLLTYKRRQIEK
ncbi:MAG: RNA ligase RtcB family protein [Candidatus Obscuribacterales bacterium]|nr:RNA ligase RtcB family protein [Candidatus Obscuribacterales bacterium]